ncbi:small integral membrane protein 5 [Acanthopagrus latus]|uniref:small integral membrane protein 5 n=1 Tax=Acanthopagrus latus TaxID=8177 RepID=UPI00187C8AEF|nr:small integral membrane protein 5 [Acanthopagrus latus]
MAEKKPSCFMEEEEEENPVGSAYIEPITTRHWRSGPMGKETEELLTPSPGQECSVSSPRMDPKEEALELLNRVWYKLQNLPNATPIDLGAFFVILTFILVVVLMSVLTCVTCCCHKTRMKKSDI